MSPIRSKSPVSITTQINKPVDTVTKPDQQPGESPIIDRPAESSPLPLFDKPTESCPLPSFNQPVESSLSPTSPPSVDQSTRIPDTQIKNDTNDFLILFTKYIYFHPTEKNYIFTLLKIFISKMKDSVD